jgi:hypothetical protein
LISFGLDNNYIAGVYEELFNLKHHGNWSFMEAYNLPITIRRWFLKRLIEQFEKEKEYQQKEIEKAKASKH